jgi:histone H3/H4
MIVARTQVKDIAKEAGIQNLSSDFMGRLDEKVQQIVLDACNRAKENARRTVMGKDV